MTKIKMGRYNRITAERFHLIKAELAEGRSDDYIMRRYEIKYTTLKYIKKSANFYEYRLYTETLPAARKMPSVYSSDGFKYEDFSKKYYKEISEKLDEQNRLTLIGGVALLLITLLLIILFAITNNSGR